MMLLKILHRMGLTDLTRAEVEEYEKVVQSGAKVAEDRRVKAWGLLSLTLCLLLLVSAGVMVPMISTIHGTYDAQERLAEINRGASVENPDPTRGLEDPVHTLQQVRARVQELEMVLGALRLRSIDYGSLKARQSRLAVLNRELGELSRKTALARKQLGVDL